MNDQTKELLLARLEAIAQSLVLITQDIHAIRLTLAPEHQSQSLSQPQNPAMPIGALARAPNPAQSTQHKP